MQFADYALWQREQCPPPELNRQLQYWRQTIGDDSEPLDLPLDRPRGSARDGAGATVNFRLTGDVVARLRALAQSRGASLFMVMLALLDAMLARYSGQGVIRVGAPIANRQRTEIQGLVGYFANVLVLRCQVDQRHAFTPLLDEVRQNVLAAQAHQDCPFEKLVAECGGRRQAGLHPLFQVKCTEVTAVRSSPTFGDLGLRVQAIDVGQSHFDLSLDFRVDDASVDCALTYATDLFDDSTIRLMARALEQLAGAVAAAPSMPLADLLADAPTVLAGGPALPGGSVLEMRADSVASAPLATAVRDEEKLITFAELDAASSRLAQRLIAVGVAADVRVGLRAARSIEFVTGVLAVIKAGGALRAAGSAAANREVGFHAEGQRCEGSAERRRVRRTGICGTSPRSSCPGLAGDRSHAHLRGRGACWPHGRRSTPAGRLMSSTPRAPRASRRAWWSAMRLWRPI